MRADKLEMLLSVEPLLEVGTLLGVEYPFGGIGVARFEVTVAVDMVCWTGAVCLTGVGAVGV